LLSLLFDNVPAASPSTQPVPSGPLPWLFDDKFCDFTSHRVCLRVSTHYRVSSLNKRVVRTNCPDRFCGNAGRAPPGFVSVTVSSSSVSTTIEHHNISAEHLTPSAPSAAKQYCLILKGERAGEVHRIKKCMSRKPPLQVVLENGDTFPLADVCQVIPYDTSHGQSSL
jgi:hypothetical protein